MGTSWSSPAFGESASVEIRLEASELEGSLLDDALLEERSGFHHNII
jgi:hypothetical protein